MADSVFNISFNVEIGPSDGDPSRFVRHYSGDLFVYPPHEDVPQIAGKVSVFIILADAADEEGVSILDVLDVDAKTEPYIALIDENYAGNFIPPVLRILKEEDMVMSRNMVILDRLEILPSFRSQGLGLRVMQACLRQFSLGCRIAAIKPFPLQLEGGRKRRLADADEWEAGMELSAFETNPRMAADRLKKHYSKLGFVSVRGTDLMVLDLDSPDITGERLPRAEEF